ncbi:MAG: rRNA maturation RNase YbeY [Pseudomonadota bacterium]
MTDSSDGSSATTVSVGRDEEEPDQCLTFDVVTESGNWRLFEPIADHLQKVSGVIERHLELPATHCEVCLALCSDDKVRELNAQYRGKDSATNILSFPSAPLIAEQSGPHLLGDLAVADQTLLNEAAANETPLAAHFTHILLHGVLHLLGFDHLEEQSAKEMEELEIAMLAELDIPDPYAGAELLQA